MEQLLLDNADRYHMLVSQFKPRAPKKDSKAPTETITASPDITVTTRIRPMLSEELSQGFPVGVIPRPGTNIVDLHEIKRGPPPRGQPNIKSFSFAVERVFGPESTTAEIFLTVVQPLVPWACAGGVGTLFAYGQTGSGKTYTVSGLEKHVAEALMGGSYDGERKMYISIVELTGKTACDLLNDREKISILEDSFGNTQMVGAAEHEITNKDALLEWIDTAAALRRTEPTKRNDTSSRSHSICRIRILNPNSTTTEDGLLYLVDLAGSESARDKDLHDAARMREASDINTSLSVLKDCIRGRAMLDADALAGKSSAKKAYVPFRQSALTKMLKHVFDPTSVRSCKTVVVACVNPCAADVPAGRNTLRYAEMLSVVVPRAAGLKYDPLVPASWDNEQVREWIERNSGTPPISADDLAPVETGPQLIRLSEAEFIDRCLKTEAVELWQAQALQTKFWYLHFDSTHRDMWK